MVWTPLLLAVSVLTWAWNPGYAGVRGLSLIGFAAVGAVVGLGPMARLMSRGVMVWAGVGLASTAALVLLLEMRLLPSTVDRADRPVSTRLLSLVGASAGILALLGAAVVLAAVPLLSRLLAEVGKWTLEIYLAHLIIVAGVRVSLIKLGVAAPGLIVAVAVVAGVAIPLTVGRFAQGRPWAAWVFDLPRPVKRRLHAALPYRPEPSAAPSLIRSPTLGVRGAS